MGKSKKLTKFNIFTMAYGSTVGSGIFLMIGIAIGDTGRSLPLALVLGAVYITFNMLFGYVISSFVPLKGGIYDHFAFVGLPVFTGVMGISTIFSAAILSGFASGIFDYLSAIFPGIAPYSKILSVILILFFFGISVRGLNTSAKVQNIFTLILIATLLIFGIVGITKVDFTTLLVEKDFFLGGTKGFITAAALMAFTCAGGETVGFSLAEDTENPTKTIPKFTLIAVVAAVITYALMCIVAVGILPVDQVAGQPLTVVAEVIFSRPLFVLFVIGGAVFALLTSFIGVITSLRYPLESLADDGWLPKFFNKKTKSGYPYVLMIICTIFAILPTLFNISFDTVVTLTTLCTLPLYIYANAACIKLPKKYPTLWKNSIFHMPYPIYVCLMVLATLASVYYAYSYVADYDLHFLILIAVVIVVFYGLCWLRVKTGGVDSNAMVLNKKRVEERIALAEKEANESTAR